MDIFFADPNEIPLPPDEVRIKDLRVEPWPDGRRVRVYIEVDPFQKRPSLDVAILTTQGDELAEASVLESMTRKMEFTLHLRGELPPPPYTLQATLYYAVLEEPTGTGETLEPIQRTVVDRAQAQFGEIAAS